eukprot:PITA_27344
MVLDINPEEVDVVISAIHPDLSFLEAWRPFLSPYHLIIVQDPELEQNVEIPSGFDHTCIQSMTWKEYWVLVFYPHWASEVIVAGHLGTSFLRKIRKLEEKNTQYVDAVMTVPNGALFPMSGINIAFDREIIGPAMFSRLGSSRFGKPALSRHSTLEDIWCGFCCKIICDHLRYGIKTGCPMCGERNLGIPWLTLTEMQRVLSGLKRLCHFSKQFACLALPSLEDCFGKIC